MLGHQKISPITLGPGDMYLQPCTEEQRQIIFRELNTTEESIRKDVKYLMEWLEQQPHLPNVKDEAILFAVLMRTKNRIEWAKKMLEAYYIRKVTTPEMFFKLDTFSTEFRAAYNLSRSIPLPKLTADGYRVFVHQVNCRDGVPMPSANDCARSMILNTLVLAKLDSCIRGVDTIVDCQNFTSSFIALFFWTLKKLWNSMEGILPIKHRKLYVLNASTALDPLIFLARIVVKKNVGDRIVLWKKRPEDLAEVVSKDILPADFGGNEIPVSELGELWFEELKKNNDWLQYEEQYKADISKLPLANRDLNSDPGNFGIDGTFRQMNVD